MERMEDTMMVALRLPIDMTCSQPRTSLSAIVVVKIMFRIPLWINNLRG